MPIVPVVRYRESISNHSIAYQSRLKHPLMGSDCKLIKVRKKFIKTNTNSCSLKKRNKEVVFKKLEFNTSVQVENTGTYLSFPRIDVTDDPDAPLSYRAQLQREGKSDYFERELQEEEGLCFENFFVELKVRAFLGLKRMKIFREISLREYKVALGQVRSASHLMDQIFHDFLDEEFEVLKPESFDTNEFMERFGNCCWYELARPRVSVRELKDKRTLHFNTVYRPEPASLFLRQVKQRLKREGKEGVNIEELPPKLLKGEKVSKRKGRIRGVIKDWDRAVISPTFLPLMYRCALSVFASRDFNKSFLRLKEHLDVERGVFLEENPDLEENSEISDDESVDSFLDDLINFRAS